MVNIQIILYISECMFFFFLNIDGLAVEILYVQNRSRPLIGRLCSCMHACMYKTAAVCVCEYKCL